MDRRQHHERHLRLALELLEPRAMLAASSLLATATVVHADAQAALVNLAVAIAPAAVSVKSDVAAAGAKSTAVHAAITQAVTQTLLRGDLNFDGHVDGADILPMIRALVNVTGFQQANNLTNAQLLDVADINKDGVVSNADFTALLALIKSGASTQPTPPTTPPPNTRSEPFVLPTGVTTPTTAAPVFDALVTTGPPAISSAVFLPTAGAFAPLKSAEALLAGGGGDAQPSQTTVTNIPPPTPTKAKTTDVALAEFVSRAGGGDQLIEGMLMKLADVDEPRLLAIEYGDETVKREVTTNKKVVPPPETAAATAPAAVAKISPPTDGHAPELPSSSYWWLTAIPAGAAAGGAAWWMYRQGLLNNVGAFRRRHGLKPSARGLKDTSY
jgi:hypothetical protein